MWRRFDLYSASQPFSVVSRIPDQNTPPALLTRIVTGPSSAEVCASAASTATLSRTSTVMPSAPISAAADAHDSGLRSQIATCAPNALKPAAMPRPMPAPAPVTTATRSVRRMLEGSSAMNLNIEQSHVKVYSCDSICSICNSKEDGHAKHDLCHRRDGADRRQRLRAVDPAGRS